MSALAEQTGSINLGQGFPDRDGPPRWPRRPSPPSGPGRNQYPPGPGIPELREAIAAHQQRFYGIELDPDGEVLVTAGRHRGHHRRRAGPVRRRRRGGGVRAVLRLVRRRRSPWPGPSAGGAPRAARLVVRSGAAGGGGDAAHPADPAQHAAQPDRQGLLPVRAGGRRRGLPRARPAGRDRRGLRAPGLRGPPRPAVHAAGHGRADPHGVERGQDLRLHRLEGGLGVRPGRRWWRRCGRSSSS